MLDELNKQDLSDFYANPLTLRLVAEVANAGEGLPKGRVDLLDRATQLLTTEINPAHKQSKHAQLSLPSLLDSAGAVFAHLLLSGSLGVSARSRDDTPDGYVHIEELSDIQHAPDIPAALQTRLFQAIDENLVSPFHRVIAEYLGARWLAKLLSGGYSERRLFQIITASDGVPTSFRGIHAWLAHFASWLTPRCIKSDPYGILRYGEPNNLSLDNARLLLNSIAALANEDPYFRNEDWGRRAVSGLARTELKNEIIQIITGPDVHTHLSTLILEALDGSELTQQIATELLSVIHDSKRAYVERMQAVEALVGSGVNVEWNSEVARLSQSKSISNKRLVLEIITITRGEPFHSTTIAEAILSYKKRPNRSLIDSVGDETEDEDEDDPYVSGMVYGLVRKISPIKAGQILDEIASVLSSQTRPSYWKPGFELSHSIGQLFEKALESDEAVSANRIWLWLKFTDAERSSSITPLLHKWFVGREKIREDIQRLAIEEDESEDGAWMAIAHELPSTSTALALTQLDVVRFISEIADKESLGPSDVNRWSSFVRSVLFENRLPESVQTAVDKAIAGHPAIAKEWKQLTAPPKRDWKKEQEVRRVEAETKRTKKFAKHRANFWPFRDQIRKGENIGALNTIANAYLGRFYDLNNDVPPNERIVSWLGDELTEAALNGFIAALNRPDIPTPSQISSTHAEGKLWLLEPVIICGISELIRTQMGVLSIRETVMASALAAWWEFPEFNEKKLGKDIESQLEEKVFSTAQNTLEFLKATMEPRISAGNEHIPGLYRLASDGRLSSVAGHLALQWLTQFPQANMSVQWELMRIAHRFGGKSDFQRLIVDRLETGESDETKQMLMAGAFVSNLESRKQELSDFCDNHKDTLWSIRRMLGSRQDRDGLSELDLGQLEFLVATFAQSWPPVRHPTSSWGDSHPWQATDFIRSCINGVGAIPTLAATEALDRLAERDFDISYIEQIKHVRFQQARLRRDTEHNVLSFSGVKQVLGNGLPTSTDDLKAKVLDVLSQVEDYIRNSDTDPWEAFWTSDKPKDENTCRHRLLDLLRPRLPKQINLLPETLMPENNRADIVAVLDEFGLPIEIKGQWHPQLWQAADVQLIQKYARDWRADDRGIYLVLWFGNVPSKNIPQHPQHATAPKSPAELQRMLLSGLEVMQRSLIDIVVLDVSKPKEGH